MEPHSVICYPAEVTFLPLLQPQLVLDLATRKDARLSWPGWLLHPKIAYPPEPVTYLRHITGNAMTVIQSHDRESQVRHLTTTPPSHLTKCFHQFAYLLSLAAERNAQRNHRFMTIVRCCTKKRFRHKISATKHDKAYNAVALFFICHF